MPRIKFHFNKLVRDLAPEGFNSDNIELKYEVITGDKLILHLKKKLLEEAKEVLNASSKQQLIDEIADIYEVLESLCNENYITQDEVHQQRREKSIQRGGFKLGIFAHHIESDEANPKIQHLKNYPKIE